MELSFLSYVKIIRLNFIKIIFISIFVGFLFGYFMNLDKSLGQINLKIENLETKNLSRELYNLKFNTIVAQQTQNEILTSLHNFDMQDSNHFEDFKESIKRDLINSDLIKNINPNAIITNKDLTYFISNAYFEDKTKEAIVNIVNKKYQDYYLSISKEFERMKLNLTENNLLQKIKKREDEYNIIKKNLGQIRKTKLICFDNCYEVLEKNDPAVFHKNDEDYFYLENKELKILYNSLKKIVMESEQKKIKYNFTFIQAGPIFTKFQIFIFTFLMTLSLSAIFFLLKENLDEKYRKD